MVLLTEEGGNASPTSLFPSLIVRSCPPTRPLEAAACRLLALGRRCSHEVAWCSVPDHVGLTQDTTFAQALHALTLADPSLCTPPEDPVAFVRSLAPYVKVHFMQHMRAISSHRSTFLCKWHTCLLNTAAAHSSPGMT